MDYRKPSDRKSMHSRIVQELGAPHCFLAFKLVPEAARRSPVVRGVRGQPSSPARSHPGFGRQGLVYPRPRVGTVVKQRKEWHMLDPDALDRRCKAARKMKTPIC